MKRRILMALLAVATATALAIPFIACAPEGGDVDDTDTEFNGDVSGPADYIGGAASSSGLDFELNENSQSYKIKGLTQDAETKSDLTLPGIYKNLPVTEIADEAFNGNEEIKNVIISDNITRIGSNAFSSSVIESVRISSDVTVIAESAFRNCSSLLAIIFPEESKVQTIADNAFEGCQKLARVNMPDSVTSIGKSAFGGCSSMTEMRTGSGVQTIGDGAFKNCSALKTVVLGDSLKVIGAEAFNNCSSIKKLEIPDNVDSMGFSMLQGCSALESLKVPFVGSERALLSGNTPVAAAEDESTEDNKEDTPTFLAYLFGVKKYTEGDQGASSSTSPNVPHSLKTLTVAGGEKIAAYGLYGVRSLETLILGDGIKSLETHAFAYCENVTKLVVGSGIETLEASLFGYRTEYNSAVQGSKPLTIFYKGLQAKWNTFLNRDIIKNSTVCFYSETPVSGCWTFDENGLPVKW